MLKNGYANQLIAMTSKKRQTHHRTDQTNSQRACWLKLVQINLRHSNNASLALAQLLEEGDFDVALVQEPYAHYGSP